MGILFMFGCDISDTRITAITHGTVASHSLIEEQPCLCRKPLLVPVSFWDGSETGNVENYLSPRVSPDRGPSVIRTRFPPQNR
jgi:hypothetical protein